MRDSAAAPFVASVLAALILTGCGPRPSAPGSAPSAPAPATAPAPVVAPPVSPPSPPPAPVVAEPAPAPMEPVDLSTVSSNFALNMDELAEALPRFLNQDRGSPHEKLADLFQKWGLKEQHSGQELETTLLTEADLNGDGAPETLAAINARWRGNQHDVEGAVFVIYQEGGEYKVDRSKGGGEPGVGFPRNVTIQAVADLTGDGRPEILWSAQDHGAHTAYAYFNISTWEPGKVTQLPGQFYLSFPTLALDGRDILLHGGGIGSAGAGMLQRARTDRYRWSGSRFALVDQHYDPSDFAYHRLQDGIQAETFDRVQDALAAYRDALGVPQGKGLESIELEWLERFKAAVPAYARFRLGVLLLQQGDTAGAGSVLRAADGPYAGLSQAILKAGTNDEACLAGYDWAEANPDLLTALSKTMGYANPTWTPFDICGDLPPHRG
jgi:hypothetical protein